MNKVFNVDSYLCSSAVSWKFLQYTGKPAGRGATSSVQIGASKSVSFCMGLEIISLL